MIDDMRSIRTAMESTSASVLGAGFTKLAFLEIIEKNSFRTNNERYGVRALSASQIPGVTRNVTLTQSFELVLTKSYFESSVDDSGKVEASYDLRELTLDIYKELVNTKAGLPGTVLNVFNLTVLEPESIDESKVLIQRSTMDITFRYSLI